MSVGTGWTSTGWRTVVSAADGGSIRGRIQWRRTQPNRFEFRCQLAINRNISANNLRIRFTINGNNNGSTGAAGSLHATNTNLDTWHTVGPVWTRTQAQVGGGHNMNNVRCQIQFQTGSFVFGGTQIGNGVWRDTFSNANISAPRVLTWSGNFITAPNPTRQVRW